MLIQSKFDHFINSIDQCCKTRYYNAEKENKTLPLISSYGYKIVCTGSSFDEQCIFNRLYKVQDSNTSVMKS